MDDSERELRKRLDAEFWQLYAAWQAAPKPTKIDAFWELMGFVAFMPRDAASRTAPEENA
jgi:hypothetical protein